MCSLVAATLILPALAYAQNNQGDDQGDVRPGIKPGIPNGTYVSHITGLVPAIPPATGLAPIGAIVRLTYFPNAIMSGGITSGVASFSVGGTVLTGVPIAGTFTVNGDGSVTEIDTQTSGPGLTLHLFCTLHPTPIPSRSLRPIPERLPPGLKREDASLSAAPRRAVSRSSHGGRRKHESRRTRAPRGLVSCHDMSSVPEPTLSFQLTVGGGAINSRNAVMTDYS